MQRKQYTIGPNNEQGMSITGVEMLLGKEAGMLKITAAEDGFIEPTIFTVYLDSNTIQWKPGHHWVRRFFNPTVTETILQDVESYFSNLAF